MSVSRIAAIFTAVSSISVAVIEIYRVEAITRAQWFSMRAGLHSGRSAGLGGIEQLAMVSVHWGGANLVEWHPFCPRAHVKSGSSPVAALMG
jgi:hypothetical protein